MTKIAVVYHSLYGHTQLQAEAVVRGAKSIPDVVATLYTVEEATAAPMKGDLETAEIYGARVATITGQFLRGRKDACQRS